MSYRRFLVAGEGRVGNQSRSVTQYQTSVRQRVDDFVVEEVAVALSYNGISHAVMMVTPTDLEAFAVGFSLTEGIINKPSEIFDIQYQSHEEGIELAINIAAEQFSQLKQTRRAMAGVSGCGLCGKDSLEHVIQEPKQVVAGPPITDSSICNAQRQFSESQVIQKTTGGIHAAAWCDLQGNVKAIREDIGRHNAVDKLIGHMAIEEKTSEAGFLMVSSRVSYEVVQKAAMANIATLVAVSAASTLAIDLAKAANIRLIGFSRNGRFVEY